MQPIVKDVIDRLAVWRSQLPESDAFVIYLFGSLVDQGGYRFTEEKGDIDLLISAPEKLNAKERVDWQIGFIPQLTILERTSQFVLSRPPEKPIVSTTLMGGFELSSNIHKDDKAGFWRSSRFLDLANPGTVPRSLEVIGAEKLKFDLKHGIEVLKGVQSFRNRYLRVSSLGTRPILNEDRQALWKAVGRHAAHLRFFVDQIDDHVIHDENIGFQYLRKQLGEIARTNQFFIPLQNRLLALGGRGSHEPLDPDELLLLSELLADITTTSIRDLTRGMKGRPLPRGDKLSGLDAGTTAPSSEIDFLAVAHAPSVSIGGLDLHCKIIPATQWNRDKPHVFEDDPEAENQVRLHWIDRLLPSELLDTLLKEIDGELGSIASLGDFNSQLSKLQEVKDVLTRGGSNAYPRLVANPEIVESIVYEKPYRILNVHIGPSRYGIALVEERRLQLPTALALRKYFNLNSLAVRVAYISKSDDGWWVEFHQRNASGNATYLKAWDIGAAGYVDARSHLDPFDKETLSPWQTAAHELSEELAIGLHRLPNRDKFRFFGVGRNDLTGHLDILGYCEGVEPLVAERPLSARVSAYGRCRLTPQDVARFVLDRRDWVPTALLTAILMLRHFSFDHAEIEAAFSQLKDRINLTP